MKSKTFSSLMKLSVLIAALCGAFICVFVIPDFGKNVILLHPEFSTWYWPWMVFALLFALPCFALLVCVWCVSDCVKNETVFTLRTVKYIKTAAVLLFTDAALLFAGNVLLWLLNMNHPGVVLLCVVAAVFEVVIALFAQIIARYVAQAAALQEESDGTL